MVRPRKKTKIVHDSSFDTKKEYTDPIPMDIVYEILLILPLKSVTKFVRVSKLWATIIRSICFINSFSLRQSMALQTQQESHRLLLAFNKIQGNYSSKIKDNWTFFSSSSATDDEKPQAEFISRLVFQVDGRSSSPIYVKGLVNFVFGETQAISNPSTGKSIILPLVKSKGKILSRFFGFDPTKAEYKVLCIMNSVYDCGSHVQIEPSHNQVLTVGCKSLWREIDLWIPHSPYSKGVCIDGIIYYLAYEGLDSLQLILVRFDVSCEKFLKQLPCLFLQPFRDTLSLINYESKLAIVHKNKDLWVLEDCEKLEWLKISHDISPWRRLITSSDKGIEILGTIPNGEIVYTCYGYSNFYVIYQDHKKNQHRIVNTTPNMDCYYISLVLRIAFIDYEESVMLL